MTTIALKVFSAANLIVDAIINFCSGIGKAVIMARGAEANYKIAEDLRHEYPDMSVPAIAAMLNDRLRKEVYGD